MVIFTEDKGPDRRIVESERGMTIFYLPPRHNKPPVTQMVWGKFHINTITLGGGFVLDTSAALSPRILC